MRYLDEGERRRSVDAKKIDMGNAFVLEKFHQGLPVRDGSLHGLTLAVLFKDSDIVGIRISADACPSLEVLEMESLALFQAIAGTDIDKHALLL